MKQECGCRRFGHSLGAGIALAMTAFLALDCGAATTSRWEVGTSDGLAKGTPTDVSITADGTVVLAPDLGLVAETGEQYVWSLAADAKGTLYAGTGNGGKVFKIARSGAIELIYDSEEIAITSLALGPRGTLYCGTMPGGLIYRIAQGRDAVLFWDSEEKYIWSLALDERGILYAGTGDEGKLYRITPDGEATVVFDSSDPHIRSLVVDRTGTLFFGTDGNGLVMRIPKDGDTFVLYDAAEPEAHALALEEDGTLYVGTTSGAGAAMLAAPSAPSPAAETTTGGRGNGTGEAAEAPAGEPLAFAAFTAPAPQAGARGAVYRVAPDGTVRQVWTSSDLLLSIALTPDDRLVLGTGGEGRLWRLEDDEEVTLLAKCEAPNILTLLPLADGSLYMGTGDDGRIYQLPNRYAESGRLESEVRDCGSVAEWGVITWDAVVPSGTEFTLATRTGNTQKPDDTWSDWSKEYRASEGTKIASPAARFLQWRATLSRSNSKSTPVLDRVEVAYLQRNLAPRVKSVRVSEPDQADEKGAPAAGASVKPAGSAGPGSPLFSASGTTGRSQDRTSSTLPAVPTARTVSWQAEDPNGDDLAYTIYFKGADEREWKLLEENFSKNSLTLDPHAFPDGQYTIRVVASDSPSNPEALALEGSRISDPFTIDNTPPLTSGLAVTGSTAGGQRAKAEAADAMSRIRGAEYSIDAGPWRAVFPSDRIFDTPEERFEFDLPELEPGEHTLVLRTIDANGNIGTAKAVFYTR
jgi:outer membrane protein assembly factor BamB